MIVGKWNYEKHEYDDYTVPNNWKITTFCVDDKGIINCVQCGKQIIADDGYVSLEVHTPVGFGYLVCNYCYDEELKRRKKYKNEED